MKVSEAKPGQVIETILFGVPSGNYYKISSKANYPGAKTVPAYAVNSKGEEIRDVRIYRDNNCRLIDPQTFLF